MSYLSAEELFQRVHQLSASREPDALLKLANEHWNEMHARPASPHDAETCRLAMLASLKSEPPSLPSASLWRARGFSRFALVGWYEGVAALMMSSAFITLAGANDGYPNGHTLDHVRPSEEGLRILDELEPFADGPGSGIQVGLDSPTPLLIARFLHEKRGFFELLFKHYDAARASYARAAEVAKGSRRGEIRVRAGLALVDYVSELDAGGTGKAAADDTEAVLGAAEAAEQDDIVRDAAHNLAVMRAGGRNLTSYEIL